MLVVALAGAMIFAAPAVAQSGTPGKADAATQAKAFYAQGMSAVQRQDRTGTQIDEANAPADISIQIYSQGNIVSSETGLMATLRHTLAQGAAALMWSLRMIGVALAFLAPWAIAILAIVWIAKRIAQTRRKL